jgi:phosphoribosylglycinamide formyltransferase-1
MKKYRLAIFASGQGSNAVNIMSYFHQHPNIAVEVIVSNNPQAGVIERAVEFNVLAEVISNENASNAGFLIELCQKKKIDYVLLAGYLRMIPEEFTRLFQRRIINIHPSLLPKFGGKGMYGDYVHRAVLTSGASESGITIHFVNEVYDEGEIIGQAACSIEPGETLESLKKKIANLEKAHYPTLIEQIIIRQGA